MSKAATWEWVNSSHIKKRSYDPQTKKLYVTFTKGRGTYEYSNVPKYIWEEWQRAKSVGSFHATAIKHKYDHRLMDPREVE